MEIEESVIDEYFTLAFDNGSIPKLENLHLYIARELHSFRRVGYSSCFVGISEESVMSRISCEILKQHASILLSDLPNISYDFFVVLLNNIESLDQILEILASMTPENF